MGQSVFQVLHKVLLELYKKVRLEAFFESMHAPFVRASSTPALSRYFLNSSFFVSVCMQSEMGIRPPIESCLPSATCLLLLLALKSGRARCRCALFRN